jgi:hypothetical protein
MLSIVTYCTNVRGEATKRSNYIPRDTRLQGGSPKNMLPLEVGASCDLIHAGGGGGGGRGGRMSIVGGIFDIQDTERVGLSETP